MKKIAYFTIGLVLVVGALASCNGKTKPGRVYMPDMAYSRAYETYAPRDSAFFTTDMFNKEAKIFYNASPVPGSIKRGELFPYPLPNDSNGYKMSASIKNPILDSLSVKDLTETGRLFNINCAICHGEKGGGNGPLATSGKIGGVANLLQPTYVEMADGTMFHSIEYGKNNMGSYASQLSREQRWKIIKYVRTLQGTAAPATTTAASDSTKKS